VIHSETKRKTSILVVDDQPENVQLMADVLASDGYPTLVANSGPEALDVLNTHQPSAILLDLMMPGMDGYEVLRRVRGNPKTAHIPVMVITALMLSDEDRVRIERDAQAIFLKGTFWIEDLLKEVARLVNLPLRTP
jgi:two-component system cell cycle response regulator